MVIMKYIKTFENHKNWKNFNENKYNSFAELTEQDLREIAEWGLIHEYPFSGAWDDDDNIGEEVSLDTAIDKVVENFKLFLKEPYPEGFKNIPNPVVAYRMLSLDSPDKFNREHVGYSWFVNPDRIDNSYFKQQLFDNVSIFGKLYLIVAKIEINNINIPRSLWQRDLIYVENEIVLKSDENIDVVDIRKL